MTYVGHWVCLFVGCVTSVGHWVCLFVGHWVCLCVGSVTSVGVDIGFVCLLGG